MLIAIWLLIMQRRVKRGELVKQHWASKAFYNILGIMLSLVALAAYVRIEQLGWHWAPAAIAAFFAAASFYDASREYVRKN